jgi:hypothetical protein
MPERPQGRSALAQGPAGELGARLAGVERRNGAPGHGHTAGTGTPQVLAATTRAERPADTESSALPAPEGAGGPPTARPGAGRPRPTRPDDC